jgi:hypothetical protein
MKYLHEVVSCSEQRLLLWELMPGCVGGVCHCYGNSAPVENSGEMVRHWESDKWVVWVAVMVGSTWTRATTVPDSHFKRTLHTGKLFHVTTANQTLRFCERLEVFTAVTMNNGVFWDVMPCGSCKNPCFGGTWRLLLQGDRNL